MKKNGWSRNLRRACGSTLQPYCVMQENLKRKLSTIMESVSWVFENASKTHGSVTELNVTLKENEILMALNYDLDVPCVFQWGPLCFSSPSRLNHRFANNGSKIAKYHEADNMAIEATFTMPFEGLHTPRTCLLRSVSAPDKDWNVEEEMTGWGLGGMSVSAARRQLGRRHFRCVKMQRRSPEHHCF